MTRPNNDPESSRTLALSAGRDIEEGTLAILGTADALLVLTRTLHSGPGASLELIPFGSDRPMLQPLTRLETAPAEGPLTVSFRGDVAVVSGPTEHLASLAAFIREFVEENALDDPGIHAHWPPGENNATGDQIIVAGRIAG